MNYKFWNILIYLSFVLAIWWNDVFVKCLITVLAIAKLFEIYYYSEEKRYK